jgi:putative nucleotidyltransferase with HDIG domain
MTENLPPAAAGNAERPRILVVDDDPGVLQAVRRLLSREDLEVILANGPLEALNLLRQREMAAVVSDQMMPVMTGVELLTLVRQTWPATVCLMMTACEDMRVVQDVINRHLVHFFVTKPWDSRAFRSLIQEAVQMHQRNLRSAGGAGALSAEILHGIRDQASKSAFSLAKAVDARDKYTHQHSQFVANYAQVVGRAMNLGPEALEELHIGGLLHDVGKIGIPDGVLLKPSRLTNEEFAQIKQHPQIGVSIVDPIGFPFNIMAIVGQHHENYDGSGYPKGLGGDQVALPAQIIHVVDAYEAMAANRVYRTARDPEWIVAEFNRCRGSQFAPGVVDLFLQELKKGNLVAPELT